MIQNLNYEKFKNVNDPLCVRYCKRDDAYYFYMVNREFINSLKSGAILINSSRGAVVEEAALLEGIRKGKLSDAILDVFENEPLVNRDLLKSLTLATPHIAGYSLDGKANGTSMSVQAISSFFDLGLNDWSPASMPSPNSSEILIDASEIDPSEMLWEVYAHTYDVSSEDQRFRIAPDSFENLRGNYPFRREPVAYAVRLFQGYPEIRAILEKLGFDVLSDQCM